MDNEKAFEAFFYLRNALHEGIMEGSKDKELMELWEGLSSLCSIMKGWYANPEYTRSLMIYSIMEEE